MSVNESELKPGEQPASAAAAVPKRIVNAQTVCNEKNEKGKLCNGHLKQLRTAGEAAEIHLRGDDVLFKCQTCGTLYMGPPLGHVRDPNKQHRFVEAELTALLQAAGGTLPVIKKDARGVFVMVEPGSEHGAAPAAAKPTPPAAKPAVAAAPAPASTTSAAKPAPPAAVTAPPAASAHKPGAEPNRTLFRRSSYAGVQDTGPVPDETFEQKVARLKAVAAAAKQRAEETGGQTAPSTVAPAAQAHVEAPPTPVEAIPPPTVETPPPATVPPSATTSSEVHKPTGQADRTLMRRSTYGGVVDTGPVPGETFAQKVERLAKLAAAAKQRAEGA
jgi:hypothetical protein